MENPINITALNDFIFCPASIYFHMLYDGLENTLFQSESQIAGTSAHNSIDKKTYSYSNKKLLGMSVYCERYNLIGKIDMYDPKSKVLTERKRKIKQIYDGYVFQLYGQYFSMIEMGYEIKKLVIHSIVDNKNYYIGLPFENTEMFSKFEKVIEDIENFNLDFFRQTNHEKCKMCIYSPYCDREV